MIVPKYYEDMKVLHKNTLPNHAYFIPASIQMNNLVEERENSDRFRLLSGQWKFRYFNSIYDIKDEFFLEGYKTDGFDTVTVPGVWQNYGYDCCQYTNRRYPIPVDPPYVPYNNPCGAYIHTFQYSINERAPKAFLNFEGVDSCFYVWVNGSFVGYSQVSHSTSEFDVSDFLREGENTLAVLVLKWCDGTYLEDQDKFRMSGIFRDVYLLLRPEEGIFDYFVKAKPSEDYKDGMIEIEFQYHNVPVDASIKLFDKSGKKIAEKTVEGKKVVLEVKNAKLWSAENPYLYTMVLETDGEVITDHIGIRDIHIKEGILYINGMNVKFHGVNRHDSDPVSGFTISRQQIIKDLTLMKEHNVNAIRTSHYPNPPQFYQLYDRFGFYVIDEADNESHGISNIYSKVTDWDECAKKWNEMIADNEEFIEATLDRTKRCVERDKNRPCVMIWSMGNECAYGCTFEAALKWTKEFDSTRLSHFESARYVSEKRKYDYSNIDLFSRMYPTLDEMHEYFLKDGSKPFIMCEFCHAMGNGPGDLEDYFQVIHQYEKSCGGFIWEWCDHAVDMGKTITGKKKYAYGGDHKEYPNDGNFCMDGLVYPDRRPHTGLLEFKNVYRPARIVSFDQSRQEIVLKNYMDFINLKDYLYIEYELLCDGVVVERKVIDDSDILNILPHQEKAIPMSLSIPEKGKCFLKVTYILSNPSELLPEGFILGFEEKEIKTEENINQRVKEFLLEEGTGNNFTLMEDEHYLVVSTGDFNYTYDKFTGVFTDMVYSNQMILERPMEYNIWRAPTDNDRNIKNEWRRAQYDRTVTRAYETKTEIKEKYLQIITDISISAVYFQRILNIRAHWKIHSNGILDVKLEVEKNTEFPYLPRFGLRMFLSKTMDQVEYCGIGPEESYIDKRQAGYHGLFRTEVKAMHEDYIRPQENGSHYDCDYVVVHNERTYLTLVGASAFSFNASVYSQEELTEKTHNYELEETPHTILCLDYRQSGIGSNSCGPELMDKYRLDEAKFSYKMRIIPR